MRSPLQLLLLLCAAASSAAVLVEDVLDPRLLPAELLLLPDEAVLPGDNASRAAAGDFSEALVTMRFHRRMMNEYLCRDYVAGQILGDVAAAAAAPRADKRVGDAALEDDVGDPGEDDPPELDGDEGGDSLKDSLLMDPGSSNYKKWLSRSKTLEDAYQKYAAEEDEVAPSGGDRGALREDAGDFDGVVTGFAYGRPFSPGRGSLSLADTGVPVYSGRDGGSSYGGSSYGGGGGGGGYGGGGGGGGYGGGGGGHPAEKGGPSKSEIIDMAMTAMAFMAFAMFKMNIVMSIIDCLTSTEAPAAAAPAPAPAPMVMVMPPVSVPSPGGGGGGMFMLPGLPMGGGGGGGGGMGMGMGGPGGGGNLGGNLGGSLGGDGLNVSLGDIGMMGRRRRAAEVGGSDVARLDGVARRALESLEAFHLQEQDGGHCFRLWLCEGNRFSRQLEGSLRVWLPVWSLGMSWVAGKSSKVSAPASLENLRAAVLGLGGARCDRAFPRCSANALAAARRDRRRRSRQLGDGDLARL